MNELQIKLLLDALNLNIDNFLNHNPPTYKNRFNQVCWYCIDVANYIDAQISLREFKRNN